MLDACKLCGPAPENVQNVFSTQSIVSRSRRVAVPVDAKPLFRPDALRPLLKSFQLPANFTEKQAIVQKWATLFASDKADQFREQELLADFVSDMFCGVLGYERPADNPNRYTRAREKYLEVDGKFADAVLGGQYMEAVPIPDADDKQHRAVAELARNANAIGTELYETQENVRQRLTSSFGEDASGVVAHKLNNKATDWWKLTLTQLGGAIKTSFKLKQSPFQNPAVADQWETYIRDRAKQVAELTRKLADLEDDLNKHVFELFNLTDAEIALLQREVEH